MSLVCACNWSCLKEFKIPKKTKGLGTCDAYCRLALRSGGPDSEGRQVHLCVNSYVFIYIYITHTYLCKYVYINM